MSQSDQQIQTLIKDLGHIRPTVREDAALKLVYLGDKSAVPALIRASLDKEVPVRLAAIQALGELEDPQALDSLSAALLDSDGSVRATAQRALIQFGELSFDYIATHLQNSDWYLQCELMKLLPQIKSEANSVLDLVSPFLNHTDWQLREAALGCLSQGLEENQLPLIYAFLNDPDIEVRLATIKVLKYYPYPKTIMHLMEHILIDSEQETWIEIGKILIYFGEASLSPIIRTLLFNHQTEIQIFASLLLGDLQSKSAIPHLSSLLNHSETLSVRKACLFSLHCLDPDELLWSALMDIYESDDSRFQSALTTLEDYPVSDQIWLHLLSETPPSRKALLLRTMAHDFQNLNHIFHPLLNDPSPEVRKETIHILARHEGLKKPLVPFLADADLQVRKSALKNLIYLEPANPLWQVLDGFFLSEPQDLFELLPNKDIHLHHTLFLNFCKLPLLSEQKLILTKLFGRIQFKNTAPHLKDWLEDESLYQDNRLLIIKLLANFKYQEVTPVLFKLLKNKNTELRFAAREALLQIETAKFEEVTALLKDNIWFVREAGVHLLGLFQSDEALYQLKQMLEDRDRDVRKATVTVLGKQQDSRAIVPLLDALETGYRDVRAAAALAFGDMKEAEAVSSLIDTLEEDEDDLVRAYAAWALGEIKDDKALEYLEEGLVQDEEQEVRSACALALGELKQGEESLGFALEDPDPLVIQAALRALAQLKTLGAKQYLLEHLSHGQSEIRATVADCLQHFKGEEVVGALKQSILDDEYRSVRQAAIESLLEIQPVGLEGFIQEHIADWPESMQMKGLGLLALTPNLAIAYLKIPGLGEKTLYHLTQQTAPELAEPIYQLAKTLINPAAQKTALQILGQIKSPKALDLLFKMTLMNHSDVIKEAALQALSKQGEAALPYFKELFNVWDPQFHELLAQTCIQMGPQTIPMLTELLSELPPLQTQMVIFSLSKLKAPNTLPKLIELFESTPELQDDIFQAVQEWGAESKPWLLSKLSSNTPPIRGMAALKLSQIEPDEVRWPLHIQLNHPLPTERLKAIKRNLTLTRLPSLKDLAYLLHDEDLQVRKIYFQLLSIAPVTELRDLLLTQLKTASPSLLPDLILACSKVAVSPDILRPFLDSPNPDIRQSSLQALGELGESSVLIEGLKDSNPQTLKICLYQIGASTFESAGASVLALYLDTPYSEVRLKAIQTLGKIKYIPAFEVLAKGLENEKDPRFQKSVLSALKLMDPESLVPILLQFLTQKESHWLDLEVQILAIRILGDLQALVGMSVLSDLFYEPTWKDTGVKLAALQSILSISEESGQSYLKLALEDDSKVIREYAKSKETHKGDS